MASLPTGISCDSTRSLEHTLKPEVQQKRHFIWKLSSFNYSHLRLSLCISGTCKIFRFLANCAEMNEFSMKIMSEHRHFVQHLLDLLYPLKSNLKHLIRLHPGLLISNFIRAFEFIVARLPHVKISPQSISSPTRVRMIERLAFFTTWFTSFVLFSSACKEKSWRKKKWSKEYRFSVCLTSFHVTFDGWFYFSQVNLLNQIKLFLRHQNRRIVAADQLRRTPEVNQTIVWDRNFLCTSNTSMWKEPSRHQSDQSWKNPPF